MIFSPFKCTYFIWLTSYCCLSYVLLLAVEKKDISTIRRQHSGTDIQPSDTSISCCCACSAADFTVLKDAGHNVIKPVSVIQTLLAAACLQIATLCTMVKAELQNVGNVGFSDYSLISLNQDIH